MKALLVQPNRLVARGIHKRCPRVSLRTAAGPSCPGQERNRLFGEDELWVLPIRQEGHLVAVALSMVANVTGVRWNEFSEWNRACGLLGRRGGRCLLSTC